MLFGAAIGSAVGNIPLAILLAFLSHYFLDLFPHIEYDIDTTGRKRFRDKLPILSKIALDFCFGFLLIFLFSKNQPIIYLYALFSILPDGFTVFNNYFPNKITVTHSNFHTRTIHFLKNKKFSQFWRILSQVVVVIVSIVLLRI